MEENKPKPEQGSSAPVESVTVSSELPSSAYPPEVLGQILNAINDLKGMAGVNGNNGGLLKLNQAQIGGDVHGDLYETSIIVGSDKSNPVGKYKPIQPDKHLCNIIVSRTFDPEVNIFTIDKYRCLSQQEYTERALFRRYHHMQASDIEDIRTFPTLFLQEVKKDNGFLVPNQDIYVGYVIKVQEERDYYRIEYSRSSSPLPVTKLYGFLEKLKIDKRPYHGELMDEHWAIKRVDLFSTLEEQGLHYTDLYKV